jgi:hypothetical protein
MIDLDWLFHSLQLTAPDASSLLSCSLLCATYQTSCVGAYAANVTAVTSGQTCNEAQEGVSALLFTSIKAVDF